MPGPVNARGRPKGSLGQKPHRDSKAAFDLSVAESRRAREIHSRDVLKVRKSRNTLDPEEQFFTTDDLSQLVKDVSGPGMSINSLLRYYQDAKELGAYGVVEECLVIARYTVGQEARRPIAERNSRLLLTGLQIIANLARTLKDLEDNDKKIAIAIHQQLEGLYKQIADTLVDELKDNPERLNRVFERVTGQKLFSFQSSLPVRSDSETIEADYVETES